MGSTPLSGAVSIVENSQKKIGEFEPKVTASINIRRTLDEAGAEANRQRIIRAAVTRLEAIRLELVTPQEVWETTAGFLMLTGQPFKLNVSATGEITVDAQVESDLAQLRQALNDSEDLALATTSPLYARDEQAAAMAAVADAMGLSPLTKNVIGLMAQKRRLFALGDVCDVYIAKMAERRGEVTAEVAVAAPLSEDFAERGSRRPPPSVGTDVPVRQACELA